MVREGLRLALPSAEIVHPLMEPPHGAALLARGRLLGPAAAETLLEAVTVQASGGVPSPFDVSPFRLPERHRPRRRQTPGTEQGRVL